jgi:hypothetical protein
LLEANAVLDCVKEPLGRLGRQRSIQNGLACLAANLGIRIHYANQIVPHHIACVRKALLETDSILARITCMNDNCPRVHDATMQNGYLALIHSFLAALERQLGLDNVLVAYAEHACLLMQSGRKFHHNQLALSNHLLQTSFIKMYVFFLFSSVTVGRPTLTNCDKAAYSIQAKVSVQNMLKFVIVTWPPWLWFLLS